jgi:Peptidase family M28
MIAKGGRLWRSALFLCLLAATASGAADSTGRVEYEQVVPAVIQERLDLVTRKLSARRTAIESLFKSVGCGDGQLTEPPVRGSKEPNIVCTMAGGGAGEIVVGGHYDLAEHGMGAVDDWSGAVLLPSLYQSLKSKPRRHRFVFIAFAAEEKGLVGSRSYVKQLSAEDRRAIRAMINLECLGLNPPKVWASRADPRLLEAYARVANSLYLGVQGVNVERVGDDDSHPFLSAGIPVLTIHSLTTGTLPILHSQRDNLEAIHDDYYYAAYRLAATYLAFLDGMLE